MSVNLSPVAGAAAQFFDNSGNVLTGGKIYTYAAGTTTPQATYTSNLGTTFHSNPIILDASGRVPGGEIWLTNNISYKFVLETTNNVLIGTYDNILTFLFENANQVAYTAPYNGAVATTVGDKLSQWVSVTDFGALGNGSNDSGAFQAAANAVGLNGTVCVPSGNYVVQANITNSITWLIDSTATITGAGDIGGRIFQFGSTGSYSDGAKIGETGYVTSGIRPFTEDNAQLSVLSVGGQIGVLGGSQSSLSTTAGSQGCIGVGGFVNNNNTTQLQSVYGGYFEARRQVNTQRAQGVEIDIVNFGNLDPVYPNVAPPIGLSNALWVACGGDDAGALTASSAISIVNNGAEFEKGLVFGSDAILNPSGDAVAIAMSNGHAIDWYSSASTTTPVARIRSDATTASVGIVFANGFLSFQDITGVNSLINVTDTGEINFVGATPQIGSTNTLKVDAPNINFQGLTTTSSATAGAASVLPATPSTYITVQVNGTNVKIPCYAV
jgi:hypothetical protein